MESVDINNDSTTLIEAMQVEEVTSSSAPGTPSFGAHFQSRTSTPMPTHQVAVMQRVPPAASPSVLPVMPRNLAPHLQTQGSTSSTSVAPAPMVMTAEMMQMFMMMQQQLAAQQHQATVAPAPVSAPVQDPAKLKKSQEIAAALGPNPAAREDFLEKPPLGEQMVSVGYIAPAPPAPVQDARVKKVVKTKGIVATLGSPVYIRHGRLTCYWDGALVRFVHRIPFGALFFEMHSSISLSADIALVQERIGGSSSIAVVRADPVQHPDATVSVFTFDKDDLKQQGPKKPASRSGPRNG